MIEAGVVSGSTFPSIVRSLGQGRASGTLVCANEVFEKKLSFWHGRVIGATSNLIDDRMGEVVYRRGGISLDNFMSAAGKVSQKMRFGEALIKSSVFSNLDLWDALNMQVEEILTSLCFYKLLQVRFEPSESFPKNEMSLQFDVNVVLERALADAERLEIFWKLCEAHPMLEIDATALEGADCDFLRDVCGFFEKTNDFHHIVHKESRLSPEYTVRALHEIYSRGVLLETLGYPRCFVSERSADLVGEIVEQANFMFAELRSCLDPKWEKDWTQIVKFANTALARKLGFGAFVDPKKGFNSPNILRACACARGVGRWAATSPSANCWLDVVPSFLSAILYSSVLVIIFEFQNRGIDSEELTRARALIDRMRSSDFVTF
jgi:hypothetical protein